MIPGYQTKSVWYICQYAVPLKYGFGTRHFYLSQEMRKAGIKVTIISANFSFMMHKYPPNEGVYNFENIDDIDTWWIRVNRYSKSDGAGRILSWFVFFWRLLFFPIKKCLKPDVIIVSSLSLLPIINGIIFKYKFKAKLVFEIRDIWPQTLIDLGHFSKHHPFIILMKIIEKAGYRKADLIIGTMPRADLHVSRVIKKPFRFHCIPQGIDPNVLADNKKKLDPEFVKKYIPPKKFIIGYAGAIGVSNGLETIISAARILKQKAPDVHIVFLGDGPLKTKFSQENSDLPNLTFAPKIDKLFVNDFLTKCDVLYDSVKSVSIYNYGLSRNKWMDYMYSGKPLIVSYSGHLSLINEASCGTAVPSDNVDELVKAILHYSLKPKTELLQEGNRGKNFVLNNRTYEKLADAYLKAIYSLFNSK